MSVHQPLVSPPSTNGSTNHIVQSTANPARAASLLGALDTFPRRHLGPNADTLPAMLRTVGVGSLDELIDQTVPANIRMTRALNLPAPRSESQALADLRAIAHKNRLYRSFIGQGYYDTITPPVILRNVLENPGWYTQYTPYQAEIAQGRLEALLNFQTLVTDLTGLDIANASMLDEATAAAEAMTLARRAQKSGSTANVFFVAETVHPQTIEVVKTRASALGYEVVIGDPVAWDYAAETFGVLLQYPDTNGSVHDYSEVIAAAHAHGALVILATDLLALILLKSPGDLGADVAIGNTQRLGVPMGYGGPHAAFMATRDVYKRNLPGRLVGISQDATGKPAMRLALQTREQHIRRDKATSNICTAQVLLAILASMYAVYHGPDGLRRIAERTHLYAEMLASALREAGYTLDDAPIFDTVKVNLGRNGQAQIVAAALEQGINLRIFDNGAVGISFDEVVTLEELQTLLGLFGVVMSAQEIEALAESVDLSLPANLARTSAFLTHPVFNSFHSETEMLRYITRLQSRDLSLANSMIALGSCTMKLNATTEMIPITWPEFSKLHPFAPRDQAQGYTELFTNLEGWLAEITGFAATSLQPNAGSQGEYAGLLTIRAYHAANGQGHRNVCLIPASAHGTNPASAAMAGMEVVVTACDAQGNVDISDLRVKAEQYADRLAALMITYPSTHGVFEAAITEITAIVHANGGQVYMDGANMNAQVGLCRPGDLGADVCHLNLHKTFSIPHGGGGPGVGPICVAAHLAPYLPGHAAMDEAQLSAGSVSAAPWGSASILPITYAYIAMMGAEGLTEATRMAILNANYIAARLAPYYPVLYTGANGRVAHECILDMRQLKPWVEVEDIAKRLMDYGFHAPTMSFPVPGTLMVEPTESESQAELDRFCDAMIAIREEIRAIETGASDAHDNALKHAPHTAEVLAGEWDRSYSREQAAFPLPWVRERKFWPYVSRIDNVYGDRNLVCACLPIEAYL